MRFRILPYKQGSRSAKALAEALDGKVLKLAGSTYKPKGGDIIINWGNTNGLSSAIQPFPDLPEGEYFSVANNNLKIKTASNKLNFFNLIKDEAFCPPFWTNKEDIPDEAFPIVCRTILSGHSGSGIVIADNRDGLVPALLYVKYIKKKDEYRIHLGGGESEPIHGDWGASIPETKVIAIQRKARRLGVENPNWRVRNHANGFVYVREGVNPPQAVEEAAKKAFEATGLDFGAVDVIWNDKEQKAYVLEINTAPGLEGQTVTDYANFFRGI